MSLLDLLGAQRDAIPVYGSGGFTSYSTERLVEQLGGWAFALVYFLVMFAIGTVSWWLGALIGLVHALFLLVVVLPLLSYVHPRMATEYDGPDTIRRLEPPGFMGMNYGYRTPLTTVAGQVLYGLILGAAF